MLWSADILIMVEPSTGLKRNVYDSRCATGLISLCESRIYTQPGPMDGEVVARIITSGQFLIYG